MSVLHCYLLEYPRDEVRSHARSASSKIAPMRMHVFTTFDDFPRHRVVAHGFGVRSIGRRAEPRQGNRHDHRTDEQIAKRQRPEPGEGERKTERDGRVFRNVHGRQWQVRARGRWSSAVRPGDEAWVSICADQREHRLAVQLGRVYHGKTGGGFEKGWENSPSIGRTCSTRTCSRSASRSRKRATESITRCRCSVDRRSAATSFSIQNRSRTTIRYSIDGQSYDLKPNYTRAHGGRPPELDITLPGEKEPKSINPVNGAEYVIRPAGDGKFEISGPKSNATTKPSTTRAVNPTGSLK